MIIAWVLGIIAIVASLVINLEHGTALQIRLLAIEQEAHSAFVAAEKQLDQCEAHLSNSTPRTALNTHDASAACEVTVIDTSATGELIRITAVGGALPLKPLNPNLRHITQTQLESVLYRDKQDRSIKHLSWRVVRSVAEPLARKAH